MLPHLESSNPILLQEGRLERIRRKDLIATYIAIQRLPGTQLFAINKAFIKESGEVEVAGLG